MVHKRKSLLNAFNVANPKRVEQPRAPLVEPPRTPQPRAGEPRFEARADHAIPVRASAPVPMAPRRPGTHSDLPPPPAPLSRARLLLLSIVGAVVLLVVVIVIKFGGRSPDGGAGVAFAGSPGTNSAAQKSALPTPAAVENPAPTKSARAALDPVAGSTDDDKAFLDSRNKFTVRLAQYENDASGVKLARDAYKYLRGEELHVVQPIQSGDGKHIYLCADAQPKKEDLIVLRDYAQRLRGPGGKGYPFRDAYIDNIEHMINR